VLHAREHWGTTLIIAAHDRDWLFDICDEVLFLFRGALLGKGEWNLVFGPWHRNGTGVYEKRLTGGQRLPMPEPPAPDAVALLSPERLRLYPGKTPAPEGFFHIDGTITRLALENATDRVSVSVSAGEITLTVRIESTGPENMNGASYRLGDAATIAYPPAAVTWRR
jgi:tungstate transport system ATP-binding protein